MNTALKPSMSKVVAFSNLLDCTIECWTDGERRVHARARLVERLPGDFLVIPFHLREVGGAAINWNSPAKDEPIQTNGPTARFDEADHVLRWWAMQVVAQCAGPAR